MLSTLPSSTTWIPHPPASSPINSLYTRAAVIRQPKQFFFPNFLLANICSLPNKVDELSAILDNNNVSYGCITESWLNKDIPTETVDIEGYACHRRDRNDGRQGGGVACYVRNGLQCHRLSSLESPAVESLWLLFRANRMPRQVSHIVIGVIYHPPSANGFITVSHIIDSLDSILHDHPQSGVILLGDFNRLNDSPLKSYPLQQMVTLPTRKTAILDQIFTNCC